jgi:hypothetical protein
LLPKMRPQPGTVHEQLVKCGKLNCRCARGERHRAFYRFWRDADGRLRKAYVPRSRVEEVRAACEAWKENNRAVLATVKGPESRSVRAEIRRMIRSAIGDHPRAREIARRVAR